MLNSNEFEFTFISSTEDPKELNKQIRDISIEGAIELFRQSNVPTEGKEVDITSNIISKTKLDNGEYEYIVSVELSNITEEAEIIE
jgi:hypothetical protein